MVKFLRLLHILLQQVCLLSFCRCWQSLDIRRQHRNHGPLLRRTSKTTLSLHPLPDLPASSSRILYTRVSSLLSLPDSTSSSSWDDDAVFPSSSRRMSGTAFIASFSGFTLCAFLFLVLSSSPGSWRYFVSGGLCAAISHAIPTPIDVIKTRKQVDAKLTDKSFVIAGRTILREEGFRALLAGLGPTSVGYLLEGAIKFGLYETLKPVLPRFLKRIASISCSLAFFNSQSLSLVLSAFVSGLVASFVLCPMEVLRIRLVSEPDLTSGWIGCGYKILKQEGINGFTKGLKPMIMKQIPYTVCKNVSFDIFTRFFYSCLRSNGVLTLSASMKFIIPLISAAAASFISSIMSQPGDTILSLSCAHDGDKKVRNICRDIIRSERGVAGFFVGTRTRLLHVGLIVTIQLLVYDYLKRLCGIGATGL